MSDSPPSDRRQRRTQRRRQQILDGAVRVFQQKGFHRATTREIAEAADVSEGTIYNYFENKDDLLLGIVNALADLDMREEHLDEMLDTDLHTAIRNFFEQHMAFVGDRYDMMLVILPEILNNPALRDRYQDEVVTPATEMFERHIQKRVDRGEIETEDVALLVRSFTAMMFGFQILLLLGDPVLKTYWENPIRLIDQIISIYFNSITPNNLP